MHDADWNGGGVVTDEDANADAVVDEDEDEEEEKVPALYWGDPSQARVEHIFGLDGRSLCMNYGFFPTGRGTPVKEGDTYREGEACKECCRKADPVIVDAGEDEEVDGDE